MKTLFLVRHAKSSRDDPSLPDRERPLDGRDGAGGTHAGGTTTFPGAQQNFKDWAAIDMCTDQPSALAGHAACQTYMSCGAGSQVTLCTQQGGSHCGNYNALGIVNLAWEVFQRNALP